MKEADGNSNVKTFRRLSTCFDDAHVEFLAGTIREGLLTENHRASTLFRGVHTPGVDFVSTFQLNPGSIQVEKTRRQDRTGVSSPPRLSGQACRNGHKD